MKIFTTLCVLASLILIAGCVANNLPAEDGPDTPQKFDADGHPNFGPE